MYIGVFFFGRICGFALPVYHLLVFFFFLFFFKIGFALCLGLMLGFLGLLFYNFFFFWLESRTNNFFFFF